MSDFKISFFDRITGGIYYRFLALVISVYAYTYMLLRLKSMLYLLCRT